MDEVHVLHGVVSADGTLEVPRVVGIAPGAVRVTVERVSDRIAGTERWFDYLQRVRHARIGANAATRTAQEIDDDINAIRNEWEQPAR